MDDICFYERAYNTFLKDHYVDICKTEFKLAGKYLWTYLIEFSGIILCTISAATRAMDVQKAYFHFKI